MQHTELKRTIIDLLNLDTEKEESALDLLDQNEELVFQLRYKLEERITAKNPLYVCNLCELRAKKSQSKRIIKIIRQQSLMKDDGLAKSTDYPVFNGL